MFEIIRNNKLFISLSSLLVFLTVLTNLAFPLLLQEDHALRFDHLVGLLAFILSITYCAQFLLIVMKERYAASMNVRHLLELLKKMKRKSYVELSEKEPTYLLNRIFGVVDSLYLFICGSFSEAIRCFFLLLIPLFLCFQLHYLLGFILLSLFPINVFGFRWINQQLSIKMKNMQEAFALSNKEMLTTLSHIDTMKQWSDAVLEQLFSSQLTSMYQTLANTNTFAQTTSLVLNAINQIAQIGVYLFMIQGILQDELPTSALILIGVLLPIYFSALSGLTKINLDTATLRTNQRFVNEELAAPDDRWNQTCEATLSLTFDHPVVSIGNHSFSFPIEETLKPGEHIYLAGASGKGKSTFLKAIAGLYPSEGISLSTKSKRIKPRNPETDKTLYLAQDPTILSRTIEENLVWGRKMTGEEKTIIETSGILAPIFQQRSWTSRLTENGADLSGGEKQRIALARILLSDAEIILLDEATSSLDDEAAEKIMKYLKKHAEKRMIIYTSHKKEEQRFCDRTIAL